MAWIAPAVMAASAVASTAADIAKKSQSSAGPAGANAGLQQFLTQRGMDLQEQMAKAGQVDAYGNEVVYDPNTNTWVTRLSPQGQALTNQDLQLQRLAAVRKASQEGELDLAQQRRVAAGEGANALLTQLNRGYGAPTREGVAGRNAVAAATGASEAQDTARGAINAAALRTGGLSGTGPNLATLDRSGLTGLRTALAGSTAQAGPLYEQMLNDWRGGKTNQASGLTGLATAPDVGYNPSALPTSLENAQLNRAVSAKPWNPYTGYTANEANKQLIGAMQSDYGRQPDIGASIGGTARTLYGLYSDYQKATAPQVTPGAISITKTGSTEF